MSFDTALAISLGHEGGFNDNPSDPGGATMNGITQRNFDTWRKERGMQTQDVREIQPEEVREIYLDWFWTPSKSGFINDETLANKYFDQCLPMGIHSACANLQLAVGDMGHPTIVDGVPGPNTIYSVNLCDTGQLLAAFKMRCADYYREIVQKRPASMVFLDGWINRLNS